MTDTERRGADYQGLPTAATRQFALLVRAQVEPRKLDQLQTLLGTIAAETATHMRGDDVADPVVPFHQVTTLHFARFVVIADPDHPAATGGPPMLLLSTNYDGPEGDPEATERDARSRHLDELVDRAGAGLDRVFSHCAEYAGRTQLKAFLAQRHVAAATFYAGSSGRSRDQVLAEQALRLRIRDILDHQVLAAPAGRQQSPDAIRDEVIATLEAEGGAVPRFDAQPDLSARADRFDAWAKRIVVAVYVALVAGAVLLGSPWSWVVRALLAVAVVIPIAGVIAFRYKETHDDPFEPMENRAQHNRVADAAAQENLYYQNQLSHLVRIKPGIVRSIVLRGVFAFLQNRATNVFNKGKLGEIPSIHFARWAFLGKGQVLFLSNFDSSWQSYLGDFIDKASSGLTAVWSNTYGYPRTRWLLRAGSRDAARFLAWTRHHQLPTAVWYSAYPALSIVNLNDNTEIRRGVADRSAIDAKTWLFLLRSVDQLGADAAAGAQKTREPSLALDNIQGIILRGYGHKPAARYLMYQITGDCDKAALRAWLAGLKLTSAAEAPAIRNIRDPFVNVAFSHRGLRALELDSAVLEQFPLAFIQDSHHEYRRRVNGDVADNDSEYWEWGNADRPVDLVLLVFADTADQANSTSAALHAAASAWLTRVVEALEGFRLHGRKEHFGFRDGIAQPIVAGSGRPEQDDNTIAPGEMLLGHRDGYGNVFHGPISSAGFNFGRDGSFLVFRQLSQDVPAFWQFCASQAPVADAITVASKLVGRWPSGAPLLRHPDSDPDQVRFRDQDDFGYLENNSHNDRYGARCPFGAHVRRSNPRDWGTDANRDEALRLSRLHRIIRRGRPYGPAIDEQLRPAHMMTEASEPPPRRGLQFLAFNANIERQFEFVQQQWCNNPKLARLTSGSGPLLGPYRGVQRGDEPTTFTVQSNVAQHTLPELRGLDSFVRVHGSTYFFMPSLTAVRLLARDLVPVPPAATSLEQVPANEQVHIDALLRRLRAKLARQYQPGNTLRDAHPKMHGCVRATFEVPADLPDELRVGVFAETKAHDAWVRLSNADASVRDDAQKDVRGLAIKLVSVPGAKLLDGEENCHSHDFLLVTHPTFVTRDVATFAALVTAVGDGLWSTLKFFACNLGVLRDVRRSMATFPDLLAARYFSMTPYLFGDRAAKYALIPQQDAAYDDLDTSEPDFLRARLTDRLVLDAAPARFDFVIQFQKDPTEQPVEDSTVEWHSSFTKLATLTLHSEPFDTVERRRFGEQLAFNPWRCLAQHRPLGGINRARRQVYAALSKFRHERNLAPRQEPPPTG